MGINKVFFITVMCLASLLTSISFVFISKTDYYIEAQDNLLLIGLLAFSLMVVYGIGLGTLYIVYGYEDKKFKSSKKQTKDGIRSEVFR